MTTLRVHLLRTLRPAHRALVPLHMVRVIGRGFGLGLGLGLGLVYKVTRGCLCT